PPTVRALIPDDEVLDAMGQVELMSDAGVGPVQVLASPRVLLGRTGHVVARCLPSSAENERRSRSVSRRHACIAWHGGHATLADLRSASGTSVNGRSLHPEREPFRLEHGDEIGLGPHVRFLFEHAVTTAGSLPAWARLTRLDRHGAGVTHVLVLTEATVSCARDAAVVAPREALDGALILRARNGRIVALRDDSEMPVELHDGQQWRLGGTTWTVAMPDRRDAAPR
ncbi:MAG: Inner rane component of cytoplasmic domain, partial [Myxococcaceae bacterium]|nr:Inner rane component of cytoplasmic domain [Myxococcaceae bacterium]